MLISFRSDYSLSVIVGVLVVLLLSVSAALTVSVLDIESSVGAVLISLLMVTFPSLAYSFGYFMMAHTYAISIVMASLSVYITKKWKYGFIVGALCLGLSMGCYQSYVGFAMALCLTSLVIYLLDRNTNIKLFTKRLMRYLCLGVGGVLSYFVGLKLSLFVKNTELLSYKGMDTMGKIPIKEIPSLLKRTYLHFFSFFSGKYYFSVDAGQKCFYAIWLIITVVLVVLYLRHLCRTRTKWKIFFLLVCLVLFPFCVNIIDAIAPETSSNSLTIYPIVCVFILPLAIIDKVNIENISGKKITVSINWSLCVITAFIIFNYLITSYIYYLKLETYYQRTDALNNRILSRIEELDGFSTDKPVAIIANNSMPVYMQEPNDFADIEYDVGLRKQYIGYSESPGKMHLASWKTCIMIKNMQGVELNPASEVDIETVMGTDEYLEMEVWPSEKSIKIIDDVVVVNFLYPVIIQHEMSEDGIINLSLKTSDTFPDNCTYAWYLYKDGERIDSLPYSSQREVQFTGVDTGEDAEYYAALFVKNEFGDQVEVVVSGTFTE